MTTQNERLRELLDEAREALTSYPQESEDVCLLLDRIDAALSEPVEDSGARVRELEAMLGFQKDSNASDLRLLRATEAALDRTQVEIDKANKELRAAHADAAAYKRDFEAELAGNAALRLKHGARDNETMFDFIARMVRERDEARALSAASDRVLASGVVVSVEKYDELVRAAGPNVSFLDELRLSNGRAETAQRERDEARAEVERLREGEECHVARPGEGTYECRIDKKCPACELRFHRIRYERHMNGIK